MEQPEEELEAQAEDVPMAVDPPQPNPPPMLSEDLPGPETLTVSPPVMVLEPPSGPLVAPTTTETPGDQVTPVPAISNMVGDQVSQSLPTIVTMGSDHLAPGPSSVDTANVQLTPASPARGTKRERTWSVGSRSSKRLRGEGPV